MIAKRNTLYYGTTSTSSAARSPDESVDLVYLDRPFNSNQDYNVLVADRSGAQSEAQIKAFEDTWRWNLTAARAYQEVVEGGSDASRAMQAFRTVLGTNDMLAHLSMMASRLVERRRVRPSWPVGGSTPRWEGRT